MNYTNSIITLNTKPIPNVYPMNLKDYVKVYDFLPKDFCETVVDKLQRSHWKTHSYSNHFTKDKISYDDDLSVTMAPEIEEGEALNSWLWNVVSQYVHNDFGYMNWFATWNGYTRPRFNRYTIGTWMRPHWDQIRGIFDGEVRGVPTLSIVGVLNDDYGGGEFILWENDEYRLKAGQVMIFPSTFMFPHRVEAVTKGTRYSYVSWVF